MPSEQERYEVFEASKVDGDRERFEEDREAAQAMKREMDGGTADAIKRLNGELAGHQKDAERRKRLEDIVSWVDAWISNPVGAYSHSALDALFKTTREKIAKLPALGSPVVSQPQVEAIIVHNSSTASPGEPVAWQSESLRSLLEEFAPLDTYSRISECLAALMKHPALAAPQPVACPDGFKLVPVSDTIAQDVLRYLTKKSQSSVEDIKAEVRKTRPDAQDKQIYNALGYLNRHGKIQQTGYGQYSIPAPPSFEKNSEAQG